MADASLMSRRLFVKAVTLSAGAVSVPAFVEAAQLLRLPSRIEVLSWNRDVLAVAPITSDEVDLFRSRGEPIQVAVEVDAAMEIDGARAIFDGQVFAERRFIGGARFLEPRDLLTVTMFPRA